MRPTYRKTRSSGFYDGLLALVLGFVFAISARADTSVVFNEVMYHPATNEPALEWIELYNQMAVDVDVSGWSVAGDIQYTFAPNTIVRGRGYAVVAVSPAALAAATGLTNLLGSFTNRLSNDGGQLLLRNNNGRVVNELTWGVGGAWPVAPDGAGVSLAKIDPGTASAPAANWTGSAQMGGTPGRENFPTAPVLGPLVFNELSSVTNAEFWLELANCGPTNLALAGYVIAHDGPTNHQYVLPTGTSLPPGGLLALSDLDLGFRPADEDKLYLLPPARTQVLDAVLAKTGARARCPDGLGPWLRPDPPTPGISNRFSLQTEVVINEIMYHHQLRFGASNLAPQEVAEAWIELFNRGTNALDLTGWKLTDGISFSFPIGQRLEPGAYLVVANDAPALRALYPLSDIIGNFSGQLSHRGESIVLEDAFGNPADTVRYFTYGRWPAYADGGGSSLELRDPNADNSAAEAWAASDESSKSVWQTCRYRGVADSGVWPQLWDDFVLGLLNDGECLLDDLSVIESPESDARQFIANGDFEDGLSGWRVLGNHGQSRVETDPANPANHVLHLVASGTQEHMHNHIETTYASGLKVTDGKTYEISFRARWLAGNNLLNTRLYFNRVARSTVLPTPLRTGTPGWRNSRFQANAGPTFSRFGHQPVIPSAGRPVTVSVAAQDPQGIASCQVLWSADGAAFAQAAMTRGPAGLYTGTIPGFSAETVVQFYVRAVDGLGATATYPKAGSNSGAFYVVGDGRANLALGHNIRVLVTPSNWALMRAETNLMSNASLPGTVIYDEQRPYYDIGVRLKGSMMGRYTDARPSFNLKFQPDDLFRGVHPVMLADCAGRSGQQEEILVHHLALHAGGIPAVQPDMAWVIPPADAYGGPGVFLPRLEDEFLETAYEQGSDGTEWQMEIIYYSETADANGYKLPSSVGLLGVDIQDWGEDKELYRYNFIIKNHHNGDDYSRFIPFAKAYGLPDGPLLEAQAQQVLDVDQWLRAFAFVSLFGESDFYSFGSAHNIFIYQRPADHRMVVFPWDVEKLFSRSVTAPLIGGGNWNDIAERPANKRRLYAHALDIIDSTFTTNYATYWVEHFSSLAPNQDYSFLLEWMPQRTQAVLDEIAGAGGNSAFSIATNFLVSACNLVTLTGTAPVSVQGFLVNGLEYPVTWNSVSEWSLSLVVAHPTNILTIVALDISGQPLSKFVTTVTICYTGPLRDPRGTVLINEIHFNPPDAAFIELLNTSESVSFDLSNWHLKGVDYTFHGGSFITNGQFLVLAKDPSGFINSYGTEIVPFGMMAGILKTNGETLSLLMPGAETNEQAVVDRVRYAGGAPWPAAAPGCSLQLVDRAQDNCRVANWAAAPATPGADNAVVAVLPPFPTLWLNEVQAENLTGITNAAGQRTAWIELYNPGTNPISLAGLSLANCYTNLTAWTFPAGTVIHPGQFKVIFADGLTQLSTPNEPHTSFTLAPAAGSLALSRLYASQPQVLDYLDYTNLAPNRSYGSLPDGQMFDRREFHYASPGATNIGATVPLAVAVNEWMAANTHTLRNPVNGKYSDWFELYNYGTNPANLAGFFLTDTITNRFKYQIPFGYVIPPRGFLLVWADEKNTNGTPDLHVNFKMSRTGEALGLFGVDGNLVDFVTYGAQADDVSEGRFPDGDSAFFLMPTPTPRTNNLIPNQPPTLPPIPNQIIYFGQRVQFTAIATDPESAGYSLTFSLDPGAPAGASMTPSGLFTWQANVPAPSTNYVTIRVTDDGTPPLSDATSFSITVLSPPQFTGARRTGSTLTLAFDSVAGRTYQLEYKDNLTDAAWTSLSSPLPGNGGVLEFNDDTSRWARRFYRLLVLP